MSPVSTLLRLPAAPGSQELETSQSPAASWPEDPQLKSLVPPEELQNEILSHPGTIPAASAWRLSGVESACTSAAQSNGPSRLGQKTCGNHNCPTRIHTHVHRRANHSPQQTNAQTWGEGNSLNSKVSFNDLAEEAATLSIH